MNKILPAGRYRIALSIFAICAVAGIAWLALEQRTMAGSQGETGTLEKLIVANGNAAIDLDLNKLNGTKARGQNSTVNFAIEANSFFKVLVFNDEFRGTLPSSMAILPDSSPTLPKTLNASMSQLVIESLEWGGQYEMAIRDSRTGFNFFNIEGQSYEYDANSRQLTMSGGRLLISSEFAAAMKRPSDAGTIIGNISITAILKPVEVTKVTNGEVSGDVLPAMGSADAGSVPGPDVIVGDLSGLAQFGASAGTQVGLAIGTDSCNFGTVNLNWFANPTNDHPVIPQNLYRMSGGANGDERFEQVGQSSVKHAFTALTNNICSLGCNGVGGTQLGSGCSDPYGASLNSGPNLGSRAWINPFTGAYPRDDSGSSTRNNNHTGHTHLGPTHRILTEIADLVPAQNPGAKYYAESQYVTPHEYAWCQTNPGQCNMFNNVSHRQYTVTNSSSPFTFSPAAATVRQKPALTEWTGAAFVDFRPDPADGQGTIGYKVTNPSPGVWHYEYAIYNQNLDRAIQSFGIPMGSGVTITNVGFHAPPQQPGSAFDGTMNDAGFSSSVWTQVATGGSMNWGSESFAANPNANAVRWGTLYNIRFDSNRPPTMVGATVGFLKTGSPITVQVQGPSAVTLAFATVSGRVTNAAGQGIANVVVSMADSGGSLRRSAVTSSLGYYSFDNVPTGAVYTMTPVSKRFTFTPRNVTVNDNIADADFVALP